MSILSDSSRKIRGRKKVGLSLYGGAMQAPIYLGLIKALVEHNIPIDIIGGVSGGAVIAGAYASRHNIETLEQLVNDLQLSKLLDYNPFDGIEILDHQKIYKKISESYQRSSFEDCKDTKAIIFTTNYETGEPEIIKTGDLVSAAVSAIALPPLMQPYLREGKLLMDGGFTSEYGVKYFKEMGADIVIGARIKNEINPSLPGFLGTIWHGVTSSVNELYTLEREINPLDFEIVFEAKETGAFDYKHSKMVLPQIGYNTTMNYIDQIKKLVYIDN